MDHPGARTAGLLHGIVDQYRKSANPGSLADLTVSQYTYGSRSSSVELLFAGLPGHEDSAGLFRLTLEALEIPPSAEVEAEQ